MELKTEASLRHARTLLAANQFREVFLLLNLLKSTKYIKLITLFTVCCEFIFHVNFINSVQTVFNFHTMIFRQLLWHTLSSACATNTIFKLRMLQFFFYLLRFTRYVIIFSDRCVSACSPDKLSSTTDMILLKIKEIN